MRQGAFVGVAVGAATVSDFHGSRLSVAPRRNPVAAAAGTRGRSRIHNGATQIRCDRDYYQTLDVSRSASADELKRAYRKLARKYHPDVNSAPDAKEKFQEITNAYEVLSNPEMRQRYDQFGEAGVKGAGAGAGFQDFGDFGPFSDLFETFFGGPGGARGGAGGRRRAGPQPGDDLKLEVEIGFEKAVFGGEHKIRFSHLETCTTCSGSGVKPGTSPKTCGTCNGAGVVIQVARTPLGAFQQQSTCPTCRGTGEVVDEYCTSCAGRGRLQNSKQLKITVPAGIDSNSQLRVRNEGDAGPRGGPPGDLYVVLRVKPSKDFRREGTTLYSTIKVSYLDAILGRSITAKTVDGDTTFDVPAGSQPGARIRLKGKGVPKLGDPSVRGDHIITIEVQIPTKLSTAERDLISQLDELHSGSEVSRKRGFWGK